MKMKLGLGLAMAALVIVGIAMNPDNASHASSTRPALDPVRTLRVEMLGLKPQRVEKAKAAILSVPGVKDVEFTVEKREARIKLDVEKTNVRALENRIRKAGFTPWFH